MAVAVDACHFPISVGTLYVRTGSVLVLVIEDDAGAAELLTRQLESGGFPAHVVRSGSEALSTAKALRPAAITLDILLPELE